MVANEPELVPSSERDNPFENGSQKEREREEEDEGVTQIIR